MNPSTKRDEPAPLSPENSAEMTFLGYRLNELPADDAEKLLRDFTQGTQYFESLVLKSAEHSGRFLVVMNSGGIMACLGVVTALLAAELGVIQVLPAAIIFILGLCFCGFGIVRAGSRLQTEARHSFDDTLLISRNEIGITHAVEKATHRRRSVGKGEKVPLFLTSFILFVLGAFALVIGLAWPEFSAIICNLLSDKS